MAVTAARISAAPTTAVPAGVTGPSRRGSASGRASSGCRRRRARSASSMPNRSMCSGLTVQRMTEKVGRALSSAAPPATASAMRMSGRASVASLMLTTMLCLREARMQASNSCRTRLSSGVSCADTRAEVAERLSQALDDARGVVDVLLDALPHRAVGLAHHGGAAVGGQVGVLAVDGQVELGLAAAEREASAAGSRAPRRRRSPGCARRSSRGPRSRRGPRARRAPGASGT